MPRPHRADDTFETAKAAYLDDGLVVLRGLVPGDAVDAYVDARGTAPRRWTHPTPYMHEPTIRDLCCSPPLTDLLATLLGEEPVLHLNLTGFRSTERAWHQDGYLNPPEVGDFYAAVWMALGDISPDAGPFEFVRGSHLWPGRLTREDAQAMGTPAQRAAPTWHRHWPTWTQEAVSAYWETAIRDRGASVEQFVPASKGDVLVWSPWLVHRGSDPRDPSLERRALISHFSGEHHRPDMPVRERHRGQGFFAVLTTAP